MERMGSYELALDCATRTIALLASISLVFRNPSDPSNSATRLVASAALSSSSFAVVSTVPFG